MGGRLDHRKATHSIDELLQYLWEQHIAPIGLMAVYADLKAQHPDWSDSEIKDAARSRAALRARGKMPEDPANRE